jgi:dihydrolipoamide dehydrogenase
MSEENQFDVLIIGAGPGGYVAAIRASQLGFKTALVEKDKFLGGTCLNVGCIPSKALLHSTEQYHFAAHLADSHGISFKDLSVDIAKLMERKSAVVNQLRKGVEHLVKKGKITLVKGKASFNADGTVRVKGSDERQLRAKHTIIATGSRSTELPFLPFDGETIVSSDEAIAFDSVPKRLAVVGAGAIGLELGSVWARLGAKVDVVEFLPAVAPTYDSDISRLVERIFRKQGLNFHLGTKVTGWEKKGKTAILKAEKDGKEVVIEADKILVAVGRQPYTEGLGLDAVGVDLDERKRIVTDAHFRTNVKGIYAIGDVVAGPMLAHKAEEEGVACVELIAGKAGHVNYDVIPNVVYTEPEIASVGISEQFAKENSIGVKVGKFMLAANGRAIASDATDGMVKVIACAKTDRLLGIQLVAKNGSELIASAVAHMEYGGSAEDIARTIHAHPTLSEAIKEAALAVEGNAIHA